MTRLLWILILSCCLPPAAFSASAKPNIVLILADDLGYGSLGGDLDAMNPILFDSLLAEAGGVTHTLHHIIPP